MNEATFQTTKFDTLVDAIADRLIKEAADPCTPLDRLTGSFRDFCQGLATFTPAEVPTEEPTDPAAGDGPVTQTADRTSGQL